MIKAKTSVRPHGVFLICACANVAEEMGRTVVITSFNDSRHMTGSLHYTGEAVDVRSKDFPARELKFEYVARVLKRLGPKYQGFLENEGRLQEHFHFEYDPPVRAQ